MRAALVILLLLAAVPASAEQHALLIGVGDYADPAITDLEGPPYDVAALRDVLVKSLGFSPARITTLVDRKATRAAILAAVDALMKTTAPGDFVFIYFSGHGTSAKNVRGLIPGLDPGTGAIYPADVRKTTAAAMFQQLVVGSRDLRPRFERLEQQRQVLVIFDSCFSGEASRSFFSRPFPPAFRFDPWPEGNVPGTTGPAAPAAFGSQTLGAGAFPYRQLLYISASSESQPARDIQRRDLPFTPTVDGQPHGAFTDTLLAALRGDGDLNRDRQISAQELYSFARTRLSDREPQTPQLRHADGRPDIADTPMFRMTGASTLPPLPPADRVAVALTAPNPRLEAAIAAIPDVVISRAAPKLLIDSNDRSIVLRHGSGDFIKQYPAAQINAVVERVQRQVAAIRLIELTIAGPTFQSRLNVPNQYGVFRVPNRFPNYLQTQIEYSAEVPAAFLLLNIDADGMVQVLMPRQPADVAASRARTIPDVRITAEGVGTEFLKLIAFEMPPAGLSDWLGASTGVFAADDGKAARLMSLIRQAPGRKSETRLKVVTAVEGDDR